LATARFFLGVDGGATRCRARLRDSSGRELGHSVGPAANIYIDFDAAMRVVRETINSVIAAGASKQEIAVCLGIAGFSEDKEAERVARRPCPGTLRASSWSNVQSRPAPRQWPRDGGLVIAGNGLGAATRSASLSSENPAMPRQTAISCFDAPAAITELIVSRTTRMAASKSM